MPRNLVHDVHESGFRGIIDESECFGLFLYTVYGLEDAKGGKHLHVFSRKKTTQKENISLRILNFLHFSGKSSTRDYTH
jgi:hypothetical protein